MSNLAHNFELPVPLATAAPDPRMRPIVTSSNRFFLRRLDEYDYRRECSRADLKIVLQEVYGTGGLALTDSDGKFRALDSILLEYARHMQRFEANYAQRTTTFDPETGTLTKGYGHQHVKPKDDPDVEAWLEAMFGPDTGAVEEFIRACRQDYLKSAAVALIIIGPDSIGKNAFVAALAHMFGGAQAVNFRRALSGNRFAGELLDCPVLHADEEFPPDMREADFRDIAQQIKRLIEHKHVEQKTLVHGGFRIVGTFNGIEKMKFIDLGGPAAVAALGERILLIQIPSTRREECIEAAKKLVKDETKNLHLDLDRIAGHFASIQQSPAKIQRFLGQRLDRSAGIRALHAAHVAQHEEVYDLLRSYIADVEAFEKDYTPGVVLSNMSEKQKNPGALRAFPVILHECSYDDPDGNTYTGIKLHVCIRAIALAVGITQPKIRDALRPFIIPRETGDGKIQVVPNHRESYWSLDSDALVSALGIDTTPPKHASNPEGKTTEGYRFLCLAHEKTTAQRYGERKNAEPHSPSLPPQEPLPAAPPSPLSPTSPAWLGETIRTALAQSLAGAAGASGPN